MRQTREEFLKDPQPIDLRDYTKEEQEEMLSFIFQTPVKIIGDKFYILRKKKNDSKKI